MAGEKAFFLTPSDVEILKGIIKQSRDGSSGPSRNYPDMFDDAGFGESPSLYVAQSPHVGIPGLGENEDTGTSIIDDPGYADCVIYQLVNLSPTDNELQPISGNPVERVYNLSASTIPGDSWLIVAREKFGSWLVVGVYGKAYPTVTTTSTTTTQEVCTGNCIWTCDGTQWILTAYGCHDSDTDTGTGTSRPDETDPPTGTGTATWEPACRCLEPIYCCGTCSDPNETTTTFCYRGANNKQPNCSTTSTTSTSTTTFPPIGGCTGCDMTWGAVSSDNGSSGFQWYPNQDTADCDACGQCATPPDGASLCDTVHVGCTSIVVDPPPPRATCGGQCVVENFGGFTRQIVGDTGCVGILPNGSITAPANTCSCLTLDILSANPDAINPSQCGRIFVLPCLDPADSGGDDGDGGPPFPTTTGEGCSGNCKWQWSTGLSAWQLKCTTCGPNCGCPFVPGGLGSSNTDSAITPCQETTSTTSTSTSTTTSTSTSTSTTSCGTCGWQCTSFPSYHWVLSTSSCTGACLCDQSLPVSGCSANGTYATTNCGPTTTSTTTTTTSTTTSTTTTCTTTAGTPTCGTCTYRIQCTGNPKTFSGFALYADSCTGGCGCIAPTCGTGQPCPNEANPYPTVTTACASTTSTTSTTTTTAGLYYCWNCASTFSCATSDPSHVGACTSVSGPYANCAACQAGCSGSPCV